jgi:hypothetical protein
MVVDLRLSSEGESVPALRESRSAEESGICLEGACEVLRNAPVFFTLLSANSVIPERDVEFPFIELCSAKS